MGWIVREAKMYASLPFLLLAFFLLPYHYSSAVPYSYSTYYPYQERIFANGEPINLSQPSRDLDCRQEGLECSIILNVTYMQTMTVYEYNSFVDREVGGRRGDDGYAVNVTADGMLRLMLSSPSYPVNEFLYPILADGERRTVIAINNQVPGPTIIANQRQTLQVTVVNNLAPESLSIHWHGQHAVDTPWMDGVAQLTQCPIPSFTNFTYRFTLDQVGTHWYHAHNGAQRTDGLHGALIVTSDSEFDGTDVNPSEFVDLPEQHTLIFIDWQVTDSISVMEIIASGSRFQDPIDANRVYLNTLTYDRSEAAPMPFVSGLINGAGWRYTSAADPPCTRIDDQNIPLAVFDVEEGKTYRFRLIGAQNAYAFRFSIQGHTMTLLSSDGVPVEEKTTTGGVDYIVIHSGERYDVLVQANSPSPSIVKGNYWMIAETLEDPALLTQRGYCIKGHRSYALLHYRQNPYPQWPPSDTTYNPTTNPKCEQTTCYAANCPFSRFPAEYNIECINVGTMQQRAPLPIPNTDVSASAFFNFGFAGVTTVQGSSINGRHFLFPPGPLVTQYSSLSTFWNDNICSYPRGESEIRGRRCTHTYKVDTGTVELVLMNYIVGQQISTTQAHPVHLHGHHFRVVKIGYGNCTSGICFNSDIECGNDFCDYNVRWASGSRPFNTNNATAMTKDTVIVPPGGYVVLRFERDNPGWWFLHCHIEPHQLEGMAMVIDESSNIPTAPTDFPECGNYPRNTCIASSYTGVGIALGCLSFVVFMQHIMTLL